jgi:hypothetical protein
MNKKDFHKIAVNTTEKYIEQYGMMLDNIDELDKIVADKLEEIYKKGWSDGYGKCFDEEDN